jgi:hypothetical protein
MYNYIVTLELYYGIHVFYVDVSAYHSKYDDSLTNTEERELFEKELTNNALATFMQFSKALLPDRIEVDEYHFVQQVN